MCSTKQDRAGAPMNCAGWENLRKGSSGMGFSFRAFPGLGSSIWWPLDSIKSSGRAALM